MPTFIKQKITQTEVETGVKVERRDWTEEELAQIRKELPSRFITVPESHAADVIRPQGNYQEIEDVPTPVSTTNGASSVGQVSDGSVEESRPTSKPQRKTGRKVSNNKGEASGAVKAKPE